MTTWQLLIVCVSASLTALVCTSIVGEAWKTVARIRDGRPD